MWEVIADIVAGFFETLWMIDWPTFDAKKKKDKKKKDK